MIRHQTVPDGGRFTVGGVVGRRACEIGTVVGILALKHAIGYEVVLRFDDGKTNTFEPHQLFPAR